VQNLKLKEILVVLLIKISLFNQFYLIKAFFSGQKLLQVRKLNSILAQKEFNN
jgi:hypothetical protein